MQISCGVNGFNFDAGLRNILSVSPCVHVNCAAKATGNSGEFVDSCKSFVDGIAGKTGKRCGSFCRDFPVAEVRDFREKFIELDDDSVESVVGDEQVRAFAENEIGERLLFSK